MVSTLDSPISMCLLFMLFVLCRLVSSCYCVGGVDDDVRLGMAHIHSSQDLFSI